MVYGQVQPWHIFDLSQPDPVRGRGTGPLLRTDGMEIFRVELSAGQQNSPYRAESDTVICCVHGRVAIHLSDCECEVSQGQMIYLPPDERHELRGTEDSVLLIVKARPAREDGSAWEAEAARVAPRDADTVQNASEESFPASDPPGWAPLATT